MNYALHRRNVARCSFKCQFWFYYQFFFSLSLSCWNSKYSFGAAWFINNIHHHDWIHSIRFDEWYKHLPYKWIHCIVFNVDFISKLELNQIMPRLKCFFQICWSDVNHNMLLHQLSAFCWQFVFLFIWSKCLNNHFVC